MLSAAEGGRQAAKGVWQHLPALPAPTWATSMLATLPFQSLVGHLLPLCLDLSFLLQHASSASSVGMSTSVATVLGVGSRFSGTSRRQPKPLSRAARVWLTEEWPAPVLDTKRLAAVHRGLEREKEKEKEKEKDKQGGKGTGASGKSDQNKNNGRQNPHGAGERQGGPPLGGPPGHKNHLPDGAVAQQQTPTAQVHVLVPRRKTVTSPPSGQ